jgi:uncharacterized protein YgiM (DUF1202 family)
VGVLRFVDAGTKALELENGMALNEPTTYAVRVAIEQAVYDMIVEGEKKGLWRYKKTAPLAAVPAPVKEEPKKEVAKIEEKKEAVAQPQPKVSAPAVETKVEEKKAEPKALFGQRKLKEAEFIYKDPNNKSQKTWMFKKDSVVNVVQPGSEGWVKVIDREKRGGWILNDRLEKVD